MSRTLTALFDNRQDAEAGKMRLCDADIDMDNIDIVDQSRMSAAPSGSAPQADRGMWASIKNAFLPDEDRQTFEEGVRRGGYVLTADVDENEIDQAIKALEQTNAVNVDERSQKWRQEGWNPPPAPAMFGADRSKPAMGNAGDEQHIDLVEEQLVVGKREVERGGVRVRSYVTEKPVHEQVGLRDETVRVERHPVDRKLTAADGDAFRERSVEMTETDEEAVVEKSARVVEELVVRKQSEDRVEDINETVRRTEVDVEDLSGSGRSDATSGAYGAGKAPTDAGSGAKGMGNEAMGNVKQAIGGLTGNDELKRKGMEQERSGEMQQGKKPESKY